MKKTIFGLCVLLCVAVLASAQNITDEDRRGFDELDPIKIDIDGDGNLDTIKPRTYQIKPSGDKKAKLSDIQNLIAFDLMTIKGQTIKSFFKYNYGTAEQGGSYWVYALKSAGDINGDGKTDLVFYSGDDTSDETILLANNGNGFSVYKRTTSTSDEW